MNSQALLECLKRGAKLRHMGAYRRGKGTPYRLTFTNNEVLWIQGSCLKPLLNQGLIRSILWSGWTDYELTEKAQ